MGSGVTSVYDPRLDRSDVEVVLRGDPVGVREGRLYNNRWKSLLFRGGFASDGRLLPPHQVAVSFPVDTSPDISAGHYVVKRVKCTVIPGAEIRVRWRDMTRA